MGRSLPGAKHVRPPFGHLLLRDALPVSVVDVLDLINNNLRGVLDLCHGSPSIVGSGQGARVDPGQGKLLELSGQELGLPHAIVIERHIRLTSVDEVSVPKSGALVAGEIGPHGLTSNGPYLVQIFKEDDNNPNLLEEVDMKIITDTSDGTVILRKGGVTVDFDGFVLISEPQ